MSLLVALVKGYSPTLVSGYMVNSLEHDCGTSGCGNAASVSGSNTPALDQLWGLIERVSLVAFDTEKSQGVCRVASMVLSENATRECLNMQIKANHLSIFSNLLGAKASAQHSIGRRDLCPVCPERGREASRNFCAINRVSDSGTPNLMSNGDQNHNTNCTYMSCTNTSITNQVLKTYIQSRLLRQ